MMMMMIRFHPEKLALILAVVGGLCIAQVAVLYKSTNPDAFISTKVQLLTDLA